MVAGRGPKMSGALFLWSPRPRGMLRDTGGRGGGGLFWPNPPPTRSENISSGENEICQKGPENGGGLQVLKSVCGRRPSPRRKSELWHVCTGGSQHKSAE